MKFNIKAIYILVFLFVVSCTPEQLQQSHFTLTTEVSPAKSGVVGPASAVVTNGSYINVTAVPAEHYYFTGWYSLNEEVLLSVENPVLVFMNADQYFVAVFEKKDSDNDGVMDDVDACPDTPEGETVDENGCSASQTDTDNDGVKDDVDTCADTPFGEAADVNGCSDSQKDSDNDGVMDDADNCADTPQDVVVNEEGCPLTYVPDNNFEQALIDLGYDDVLDNYVLTSNIVNVLELDVSDEYIDDLTGIEDFTSLTYLDCSGNDLTSLDLTQNTDLLELYCGNNDLISLDVTQNLDLVILSCGGNNLTSLDVTQNADLFNLVCQSNDLTSLDVSKNRDLTELNFSDNDLTSLDVTKNTDLAEINGNGNNLTSFDVYQNTALRGLILSNNNLTSLNVSHNTSLTDLNLYSNNLTSLDVSQNTALTSLECRNNAALTCIQVNQPQLDNNVGSWLKDGPADWSLSCP